MALVFALMCVKKDTDMGKGKENRTEEGLIVYKRPDFLAVTALIEKLENDIDSVDTEEYIKEYEELNMLLEKVATASRVLMIERYNNINSTELLDEYNFFYGEYNTLYEKYARFVGKLMLSDKYECLTEGWSEKDLEADREICRIIDEDYAKLNSQMSGLIEAFYRERTDGMVEVDGQMWNLSELTASDRYTDEEKSEFAKIALINYYDSIKSIYLQIVKTGTELAHKCGYESVEQYKCGNTKLDSEKSLLTINEWVKNELVPLYFDIYKSLKEPELSNIVTKRFSYEETVSIVRAGLSDISDGMRISFDNMLAKGHAGIGAGEGKSTNNFTTYLYSYGFPYMSVYLYEKYIDCGSILHEFGHYYAYEIAGADVEQDTASFEAMAQMMNAMYWADRYRNEGASAEVRLNILSIMQTAILSSVIDELEQYVYDNQVQDAALIDRKYAQLLAEYGLIEQGGDVMGIGNWTECTLIFDSPFYYRSYLVSSIPTLLMLAESFDGEKDTAVLFEKILSFGKDTDGIIKILASNEDGLDDILKIIINNVKRALQTK